MEGKLDINTDSTVDIEGVLHSAETDMPAAIDAELLAGTEIYILATDISVTN